MALLYLNIAVIALFLIASYNDFREFKIPNWISAVIILAYPIYLVFAWTHAFPLFDVGYAVIVLAVGFLLYTVQWLGAGDVKLMTAGVLWSTHEYAMAFLLMTFVFGGVLALLIVVGQKVRQLVPALDMRLGFLDAYRTYMPYGIAISVAGIIVTVQKIRVLEGL